MGEWKNLPKHARRKVVHRVVLCAVDTGQLLLVAGVAAGKFAGVSLVDGYPLVVDAGYNPSSCRRLRFWVDEVSLVGLGVHDAVGCDSCGVYAG